MTTSTGISLKCRRLSGRAEVQSSAAHRANNFQYFGSKSSKVRLCRLPKHEGVSLTKMALRTCLDASEETQFGKSPEQVFEIV